MNTIRSGIYARLAADVTLTALLATPTSIFHRRAPQEAETPFVIFHKAAGNPTWTFGDISDHLQRETWLVKGIDRAPSSGLAEDIAARVEVVLTDAPLVSAGHVHLYVRRESDVDYGEDDGADLYHHVGAVYRLVTQPA